MREGSGISWDRRNGIFPCQEFCHSNSESQDGISSKDVRLNNVEIKPSAIHGHGVFATRDIVTNEVLFSDEQPIVACRLFEPDADVKDSTEINEAHTRVTESVDRSPNTIRPSGDEQVMRFFCAHCLVDIDRDNILCYCTVCMECCCNWCPPAVTNQENAISDEDSRGEFPVRSCRDMWATSHERLCGGELRELGDCSEVSHNAPRCDATCDNSLVDSKYLAFVSKCREYGNEYYFLAAKLLALDLLYVNSPSVSFSDEMHAMPSEGVSDLPHARGSRQRSHEQSRSFGRIPRINISSYPLLEECLLREPVLEEDSDYSDSEDDQAYCASDDSSGAQESVSTSAAPEAAASSIITPADTLDAYFRSKLQVQVSEMHVRVIDLLARSNSGVDHSRNAVCFNPPSGLRCTQEPVVSVSYELFSRACGFVRVNALMVRNIKEKDPSDNENDIGMGVYWFQSALNHSSIFVGRFRARFLCDIIMNIFL